MLSPIVSQSERPLIFLPGWGFDGRVLNLRDDSSRPAPAGLSAPAGLAAPMAWPAAGGLLDPLTCSTDLIAWLNQQNIECCELLGWSMGGLLALEFARLYPQRVAALHLLAVRKGWSAAEIAGISGDLTRHSADFMQSFYRKSFLGYREAYRRFQRELETAYLAQALGAQALLQRGLDFLATASRLPYPTPTTHSPRIYCLHGGRDLLVAPSQRLLPPGAKCQLLEHAGHALFLDYPPPTSY